ncbi:ras-related and estrogen-regulated growth inhibitor-like [Mercenaria mercenaria]|uniref:ras-related and estrogen-regulated growth inhibitor-like n=1 Tax=Mercenaria mercenaria TaxID=6596 RepID=UPI001E1D85D4|nr:ras-related and estrogen-regulated growth inhibitor-like [Mercenaria mercenaria]
MNGTKPPVQNGKSLVNGQRPRTPNQERDFSCCRIVLLGNSGVGKTALTVRYLTRRFIGEYCPTLESIHKVQTSVDGEDIRLEILDTAGQVTDTGCAWKDYYAFWGDCFIYVYSINDKDSFEQIINFKRQVESVRRNTVCGLLVGNKSDLLHDRHVPESDGIELADEIGCRLYEVSAADWTQVDKIVDMFGDLVRDFRKLRTSRDIRARRPSSSTRFRQAIQKVISGRSNTKRTTNS